MEQKNAKKSRTDTVCSKDKKEDIQLTCIISVSHEVGRINEDKKRSNIEQDNDLERTNKSSKIEHVHTEQQAESSQIDKDKKAKFLQILQERSKHKKSLNIKGKVIKTHVHKTKSTLKVVNEPIQARARPLGLAGWLTGPVMAHVDRWKPD